MRISSMLNHLRGIPAHHAQRAPRGLCVALLALLTILAAGGCAPTSSASRHTSRATATPSAPDATPTTQQLFALHAQQAFGSAVARTTATYDPQRHTLAITGALSSSDVPLTIAQVNAAHELTMALCFQAQHALWTPDATPNITLDEITVTIQGPIFDDYGNTYTDSYGAAILNASTAAHFAWNSLTPDTAWATYNRVWLRPAYEPNWIYGKLPTPTA
ncbi:MAG: hypothetical protein OJF49_002172 [Ktedonobacterales bacterium]|jgi:hypothetical protein|nr:MAG: hypothetical protein OJF49_002172 [Ktedonobacterales bacterium]